MSREEVFFFSPCQVPPNNVKQTTFIVSNSPCWSLQCFFAQACHVERGRDIYYSIASNYFYCLHPGSALPLLLKRESSAQPSQGSNAHSSFLKARRRLCCSFSNSFHCACILILVSSSGLLSTSTIPSLVKFSSISLNISANAPCP